MVSACSLGREQQKHQVNRLAVERIEIDWAVEAREQAEKPGQLRQLAVGNGDAVADGGGAELFALHQALEQLALALAGERGRALGELLQQLFLVAHFECRSDRL